MLTQQVTAAGGGAFFGKLSVDVSQKVENTFEAIFTQSAQKYEKSEPKLLTRETATAESKVTESVETEQPQMLAKEEKFAENEMQTQDAVQPEETDETELAERAASLVSQVVDVIQKVLELSEEQLQQAMDVLGISETDLLNPDTLKQLVLQLNGEQDVTAFLTDDGLMTQMQQLTEAVNALVEESGLDMEQLLLQMEQDDFRGMFEEALEQITDEMPKQDEETPLTETTDLTAGTQTKEQEITFNAQVTHTDAKGNETRKEQFSNSNEEGMFAEQFLQNLQNSVTEEITGTSFRADLAAQIREIAEQILEKVKMVVTPETTSLEVQLTPEHLGKVSVTVSEQDGVMKASFVTENELAKEAIESNLIQFKQVLNEQGIKVETIEVMVSDFAFDKNNEAGQNEQQGKKNAKTMFVMDEDEDSHNIQDEFAAHFLDGGESTVNYLA